VFAAALEREGAERDVFLADACAEDNDLKSEVHSLLAAHDGAGGFIETPATPEFTGILPTRDEPSLEGRRVGPYQLVRRLGQGGMGAVYLADRADETFQKQVAIKLIRPGLDSAEILRRFRTERQTLADLDHTNIAKLLDGGTTEDGLPYLVMEYVEGSPIDEFSDERRLSIRERVGLFRTVCTAVQAAHRSLVVHRDIKPSNILVTASGEPKLLDFGIAKILPREGKSSADFTRTVERMMTPQYASPEQLRGGPISTSSDIYSLGVLLYRLLTGHHPYQLDGLSPGEMERLICEQEPSRPSTSVDSVTRASPQTNRQRHASTTVDA
jgi:serine/threonine protein kinase